VSDILIEVLFRGDSLAEAGYESRDEMDEALADALEEADIGRVSGGGGGVLGVNIDIDIFEEEDFEAGLALIRSVLLRMNAPQSTEIVKHSKTTYNLQ